MLLRWRLEDTAYVAELLSLRLNGHDSAPFEFLQVVALEKCGRVSYVRAALVRPGHATDFRRRRVQVTWRYFESEWEDGVLKFRPCRADDGGDITARSQYNAREMVMVFQDSDAPSVDSLVPSAQRADGAA